MFGWGGDGNKGVSCNYWVSEFGDDVSWLMLFTNNRSVELESITVYF